MEHVIHNGCIGHPITNLLMATACAADMGVADHVDAGAVVDLAAPAVAEVTVEAARKTLREMCYGDMITQEMVDAVQLIVGEVA